MQAFVNTVDRENYGNPRSSIAYFILIPCPISLLSFPAPF